MIEIRDERDGHTGIAGIVNWYLHAWSYDALASNEEAFFFEFFSVGAHIDPLRRELPELPLGGNGQGQNCLSYF